MNLVPKNAVLEWRSSKKGSAEETLYLTRWALDVPFFIECLKCCMDPGVGNYLVMMKQVQQRALELMANKPHTPTLELSDDELATLIDHAEHGIYERKYAAEHDDDYSDDEKVAIWEGCAKCDAVIGKIKTAAKLSNKGVP